MSDTSLLDLDKDKDDHYRQLLLNAQQMDAAFPSGIVNGNEQEKKSSSTKINLNHGFCIKTKDVKSGAKIFINICTSEKVPLPKDISDEDLLKMLNSENPTGFRIPMSLGEPHAELDKGGKGCTVYDVVINPGFLAKTKSSQLMHDCFISIIFEGLDDKYELEIDRDWKVLKNRKFFGSLPEQHIRQQSKPLIMEVDRTADTTSDTKPPQQQKLKGVEPKYKLIKEPPDGPAEFIVAEIELPKIMTAESLQLDLGEDRILLQTRGGVYHLDVYLPINLLQAECGAQFNRKTKILTVTMPVIT